MAIGFDICTTDSTGFSTTLITPHITTVEPNRYLLVATVGVQPPPTTLITYAGINVAHLLQGAVQTRFSLWGLVAPAAGANNLVIEGASARTTIAITTWYGVDQVNPVREATLGTNGNVTIFSLAYVANLLGDMLVYAGDRGQGVCGWAAVAPSVEACEICVAYSTDAGSHDLGVFYDTADAAPDTVQATTGVARVGELMGVALRPYVPALGRQVRYYFNVWDPKVAVRDRNDRIVPPNEIVPDSWVEVQGHILPDPSVYETFITDPTKARIVEVTSTEQGATLRANRSQFADVLISRASAGRA